MMAIGFTGTRNGCTPAQLAAIGAILNDLSPNEVRHGCCKGADADFAEACRVREVRVVGHPSNMPSWTSEHALACCNEILPAAAPLDRNKAIVLATHVLVACPEGPEVQRSGTWSTIRYARKLKRPVAVVWPDGRVEWNNRGEETRQEQP